MSEQDTAQPEPNLPRSEDVPPHIREAALRLLARLMVRRRRVLDGLEPIASPKPHLNPPSTRKPYA